MTASHARSQLRHRPVEPTFIVMEGGQSGQFISYWLRPVGLAFASLMAGVAGVECLDVAWAGVICHG
jgi:hypothetical protein